MLPDIPPIKREITKALLKFLSNRIREHMGVIGELRSYFVKEGGRVVIIREDGSVDETTMNKASAELSLDYAEVPMLTHDDVLAKLDQIAQQMASQMSQRAFETINEAVEAVGNTVNAGGRPLGPDACLEILEKMHLDFNDDGTHREVTVVVHPECGKDAMAAFRQMTEDPEYSGRYKALIEKKWKEWCDREAARKLVG
ncbi:hypothetical protein AB4Z32_17510 [Massilia sp. 2TAF26]|uniref:hypothetical protein n=1 Tax=Massilia sp. 2TAF26 TaxID=3233012 RepID=UPI003F9913BA